MKYATCTTWAEYFKEKEDLTIAPSTIQYRLKKAEKTGGKADGKAVNILHSELDVREACTDILAKKSKK